MRKMRSDRYLTFRARVHYEYTDDLTGERVQRAKTVYYQTWESVASIAGMKWAVSNAENLFEKSEFPEISSVSIVRLNPVLTPDKGLYEQVLRWSRSQGTAGGRLADMLQEERRQIRGFKLIDDGI